MSAEYPEPYLNPRGLYASHVIGCPLITRGGCCDCPSIVVVGSRGFDYSALLDRLGEGHYTEDDSE
jgi:hypothetical protein